MSDHFPVGCMKIGTSFSVPVVSDVRELAPSSDPIVFVVGAFAHGKVRLGSTLRFFTELKFSTKSREHSASLMILRSWEVEGKEKAEGVAPPAPGASCEERWGVHYGTSPSPSFAHTGGKQRYEMAVFLP